MRQRAQHVIGQRASSIPIGAMLVLALTGTAAADARQVLVFELTGSVAGDPGDALPRLTQVVARAAGLTEATVVIGKVSFEDAAALAGCASTTPTCLAEIADELHVDDVVLGRVQPAPDGAMTEVALTAFLSGAIHERTFVLAAPGVEDMITELARAAPALFIGAADAPAVSAPPAMQPIESGPPPPSTPENEPAGRRPALGRLPWALAGAGLAVVGTGAVFLTLAGSRQDDVDDAALVTFEDFERVRALESEGQQFTNVGNGLLLGGSVLVAAAGALLIYRYLRADDAPARIAIVPTAQPGAAGVSLTVTLP